MTKYLLSDGKLTTDLVEYAIDYIKTYLTIKYNDVPYSSFGNSMDLAVNIKSELIYQIRNAINTAIAKLNSDYPDLSAKLDSVDFEGDRIQADISMQGENIKFSIS